ncbi:putative clavaminate synthase-like protein [Phaeoacremonium minimum UCRPA7]|uniref:Putative clavaminate synthase-like protein n=1 Tax=Phaeoacremonium minimum (strain UCR-PA7) TaxID=1286976 RepID=R8BRD5_PHAM7|nr:putative clavaminate synthase-like protein [Phaeoacremonium minimum UCRPA7]EOO01943.1 putative clavaminate synthase-like protein [Phaeoacremonium minimum UCRPA7]
MPHTVETPTTHTSFSGNARIVLSDKSRKADFNEIPIISLASPREEVVVQVFDACTRVGFFYIKDHDVPQDVIDKTFDAGKMFFALPIDQKNETHFRKNKLLRGYEGPGDTKADSASTHRPDLNESFNWGYEADLDPVKSLDSIGEAWGDNLMQGPNYWPSMPGFKERVSPYYAECLTLGRRLIRLFASALGAPENYFDEMFRRPGAMMRLIHYPPQQPDDVNVLGISPHQDIECFTILCQGEEAGLQILNGKGEWIEAPPIKGTFVVNIGDMMSRWSNDVFTSTLHRVINKTGRERYTIPFFFGPSYDAVIAPLPFKTCNSDGKGPRYEPVQAGEYVWKRLADQKVDDKN